MSRALLSDLIGSRICHDLISPIGAIGNGLELLELAGLSGTPELDLIRSSLNTAVHRLRLFRLAFGKSGGTQMVSEQELEAALSSLRRDGRVEISWEADGMIARSEVRALVLGLMCCDSAMPRGGRLTVRPVGSGWQVSGSGESLLQEPRLWDYLQAPPADMTLDAGEIHFAILAELAGEMHRQIQVHRTATAIRITL